MENRSSQNDSDMISYNNMEICSYRFTWRTEELDAPVGHFVESEDFFAGINRVTKFRMRWYPGGKTTDGKELFAISLMKTGGHGIEARCRLTCVEEHGSGSFYSTIMNHAFYEDNAEARFKEQHKIPFSSTRLILKCELRFDEHLNIVPYSIRIKDYLLLSEDIRSWLDHIPESERFVLQPSTGLKPYIGVHKEISKCRSSALNDLGSFFWEHQIPDCDVVNEIVNYMYLGDFIAEEKWTIDFATRMYLRAWKYGIHGLYSRLIIFFKSHIKKDTVLKVFRLSNELNDTILTNECLIFIARNLSLASDEYRFFRFLATQKQVIQVLKLKGDP